VVEKQVHLPISDSGQFAIDGHTLWVAAFDQGILGVDTRDGQVVDRWNLDKILGGGPGGQDSGRGVTVGDGSVWVSRDVGSGEVVRLDPATGRVQRVFADLHGGYINLAYGDGVVWTTDNAGMNRIDPRANSVRHVDLPGVWNVAAGGGYGWASDDAKGVVYKVDQSGRPLDGVAGLPNLQEPRSANCLAEGGRPFLVLLGGIGRLGHRGVAALSVTYSM